MRGKEHSDDKELQKQVCFSLLLCVITHHMEKRAYLHT